MALFYNIFVMYETLGILLFKKLIGLRFSFQMTSSPNVGVYNCSCLCFYLYKSSSFHKIINKHSTRPWFLGKFLVTTLLHFPKWSSFFLFVKRMPQQLMFCNKTTSKWKLSMTFHLKIIP